MSEPSRLQFQLLEAEVMRCPFHHLLDLRAVDAAEGSVSIAVRSRAELSLSPTKSQLHGGAIAALVDVAGHAAVAVQIGSPAPTTHLSVDYISPAIGLELIATARVLESSRRRTWVRITVIDDRDTLVAVGTGTFRLP